MHPSRSQHKVVAQDQATLDRALRRSIIRRTSVAGLIGLVYGLCAGVILAAYHHFGSLFLPEPARLLMADPTPPTPPPAQSTLYDPTTSRGAVRQGAPEALAVAGPLASPTGEIRPAMARWPAAAPMAEIDPSATPDGPDLLRDELMPEEQAVAAAPKMSSAMETALRPHPAPAAAEVTGVALALPRTPAFKPLDLTPTLVAETGLAAVLGASGASRTSFSRSRPPTPSMKPIVVASDAPPEPAPAPEPRAVRAQGRTLPVALRAFWTNLKILLASAPASSEMQAGSGGNGPRAGASRRTAASGGDSPPSGNGSPTDGAGGSGAGDGNASAGGGSSGAGGGSASAGDGDAGGSGGSASDGGGSAGGGDANGGGGGSSASSGDDGGVSSGGSRGPGRSDGGRGRGGRGDRDRDNDRGSRGDDRGGRGDGDHGGRGHGRDGDDD
jgi:hypothetical protein